MDPDQVGDLFRFVGGRSIVGRLAVLSGFLTPGQLEAALAARSGARPVGELLVELGFLSENQRADLEQQEAEILRADRGEPSGRALGHYLLVEQLGGGQAGIVWKAWDTKLQRWVAVKEARDDVRFSRERFLREARAAAKVRHPHLVQALEVGRHEGHDFMVMNYVDGKPLDQAALPLEKAAAVMADIAGAVSALHAAGVLHRDIKPQNILLDGSGHGWLADFGIARDRAAQPLTLEGTLMGTPVYMAPEQALGRPDLVHEAADVYGLGSTLYHLVTGRAPFLAEDNLRTLLRRLSDEAPVPARQLNADLPADLDFIIRHALEKHPENRYPGAAEMEEDLRRFLRGEPPHARPAGPVARSARWLRRKPRPLLLAAGAVALTVAGGFAISASRRQERYLAAYQEGLHQWTRGSTAGALARFEEAAIVKAGRPEAWVMKGRCLVQLGRPGEATQAYARALQIDPSFGPALLELGKATVSGYVQRRLPPAVRVSGGTIRFGAPDPEGPQDKALRAAGEANLAQARAARGLDPVELRFLEGALALGQGRLREAVSALAEYVGKNRWDPAGFSFHAAAAYLSGDLAAAERSLSTAIALQPHPDRYKARGDVRYALGRHAEAADDYHRAGNDPSARCSRGLALQALGLHAEAVDEYTRALELRPGFARAYNNRGTAKFKLRDFAGAKKDFEQALEADEFYAEAYHNLGGVLLETDHKAEALRQFDLALARDPDYVEAYVHRALAKRRMQQYAEAVDDLEQALSREPGNPETLLELARTAHLQGDAAKAVESVRKALAEAPESWELRPLAAELLKDWSR
jgi:tetratricopeptide (TPR) repeat protein/predicted Ser/Thr protein kinase